MSSEISNLISACEWFPVRFLLLSKNVFDPLIYYSHLFPLVASLILIIFLYIKSSKTLAIKMLLISTFLLSIWLFGDLVLWATNKPPVTMYAWTVINMIEPMIYAGFLYFLYLFIEEKDISFLKKLIIILLLIPTVFLASTKLAILGYNISNCDRDAVEGPLVYYGYFIECIFILWILFLSIKNYIKRKMDRKKIALITFGSLGFLIAFSFGNVIGSLFDTNYIFGDYSWTVGQYGIFGVPVFLAFLAYIIVKYKTFSIKIFSAQILMVGLIILIGSQFFFIKTNINRTLTGVTLASSIVFGLFLVRSVKREIEQREKIEKLAKDLERANEKLKELDQMKSEFLSLATHQIRSPLTSIKGYASLILEGDYGEISDKVREAIKIVFNSSDNLVKIVGDFLNISRIEQGRMIYNKEVFEMNELAAETIKEYKPSIEKAGINLKLETTKNSIKVNADKLKIKQIIGNIIDNAVKYTPKEKANKEISVKVFEENGKAKISVKDYGIGISPEEIGKLFNKFSRTKDAHKTNVTGTGLGLYIGKKMAEAQNGDIKVSSEGENKGSTFTFEIFSV